MSVQIDIKKIDKIKKHVIVTVTFNDYVETRGWVVRQSQHSLSNGLYWWVSPPSAKINGKYFWYINLPNKSHYKKLEGMIAQKVDDAHPFDTNQNEESNDSDNIVNLDDLPF